MSGELKADLKIPDIWYDFYSRLVPGAAFVFVLRYMRNLNWTPVSGTEVFLLVAMGYFVGLFAQPLGSLVAWLAFRMVEGSAKNIATIEAELGPETRRSQILSKMRAETVFFCQVFVLSLGLGAYGMITGKDFPGSNWYLALIIVYAALSSLMTALKRKRKAKDYSESYQARSEKNSTTS